MMTNYLKTKNFILLLCLSFLFHFSILLAKDEIHPGQRLLDKSHYDIIDVKRNPKATVAIINPSFFGSDFGTFKLPTEAEFMTSDTNSLNSVLEVLGTLKSEEQTGNKMFIPPETGRALLLPPTTDSLYQDVLVKGTGANPKFIKDNKLRFSNLGFDGWFEVSEATRDLIHSEVLQQAGVLTSRGLTIVDHHQLVERGNPPVAYRMGNYSRTFIDQTRLSNLVEFSPEERKKVIDDAISRLQKIFKSEKPMTYVEYYSYMTRRLAKNAAIYQAIGYTQDSLHFGQVTLAGEMTDLGIGTFDKPTQSGVNNTKYPWFRYERQPMLIQNMLYKTHSVKAEPLPVELSPVSKSVINQDTLYGFIKSFDPKAADEIDHTNPTRLFWEAYDQFFREYDTVEFKKTVLAKLKSFYNWTPNILLKNLKPTQAKKVLKRYNEVLLEKSKGLHHDGRWGEEGLTSLEKKATYYQVLSEIDPTARPSITAKGTGLWILKAEPDQYIDFGENNLEVDLSWKPADYDSFQTKKMGVHPLDQYLKASPQATSAIFPGRRIVWMTKDGVSPYAVLVKQHGNNDYLLAFEDPITHTITKKLVKLEDILKFNNPLEQVATDLTVAGTEMEIGPKMKTNIDDLKRSVATIMDGSNKTDATDYLKRQLAALHELVRTASTRYYVNLDPGNEGKYLKRLQQRLSGAKTYDLEKAMIGETGNCMDQTSHTALMLDQVDSQINVDYKVYIAANAQGKNHWYIIATLFPSQKQYIIESSFAGPRVFPIEQMRLFHRWPLYNIVDQFGAPLEGITPASCRNLFKNIPRH